MKSILLASVATVAFAGVAAAEVTFSGGATVGYNDTSASTSDNNLGFYGDLSLSANFSQELNNGLTVAASMAISGVDDNDWDLDDAEYELSVTSESAGFYIGDTDYAAAALWSGLSGMADNFDESYDDYAIRGEVTFGGVSAAISYGVWGDELNDELQVAATGSFGSINFGVAYQAHGEYSYTIEGYEVDSADVSIIAVQAGTSLGGADVTVAYASINDLIDADAGTSMGVEVSYPAGAVTVGGYYAMSSGTDNNGLDDVSSTEYGLSVGYASGPVSVDFSYDADSGTLNAATTTSNSWGLDGSYDVGNGIMAYAGVTDSGDDMYVAGTYDLGGGASLLVSYATDGSDDSADEIGANEYQEGTTVEVSFAF